MRTHVSPMKKRCVLTVLIAGALHLSVIAAQAGPILLSQNFDDVTALAGWVQINNSAPPGSTGWFQGNSGVFDAQHGAGDSYIAANYLNASPFGGESGGGDISNWLLLPMLSLADGDQLTFFTRSGGALPDSLEVRWSANGASVDVGGTASSVGDFSTLLFSINPQLSPMRYPSEWIQVCVTMSGLGALTDGRLAFRYAVTNNAVNGDYIGIDTVTVKAERVPEPATWTLLAIGAGCMRLRGRWRRKESLSTLRGA